MQTLKGLQPYMFRHPLDNVFSQSAETIPFFKNYVDALFHFWFDNQARLWAMTDAVRVSELQFPQIYSLYKETLETLDFSWEPEVYVLQDPHVNAFAYGISNPFIGLHTSLFDIYGPESIKAIMAHELGHIMCKHLLAYSVYHTIGQWIHKFGFQVPIGKIGFYSIYFLLREWSRRAEFTCDRVMLLATQDLELCEKTLLNLLGGNSNLKLDVDAYLEQYLEYQEKKGFLDVVGKLANNMFATHPNIGDRILELRKWHSSDQYNDILLNQYPEEVKQPTFAESLQGMFLSWKEDINERVDLSRMVGEDFYKIKSYFSKFF